MLEKTVLAPFTQTGPPLANFRFLVIFYGIGGKKIPNPVDIRFQKVSGIEMSRASEKERKKDKKKQKVPKLSSTSSHLTLARGFIPGVSPLRKEIEASMEDTKKIKKWTIHVMLMNEMGFPAANWLFFDAVLTGYSLGELDASQDGIFVEQMKFQYSKFQQLSL